MAIEIHGHCAMGFEAVRETFAAAHERGEEIGSSVAIDLAGENVVDLWAGHSDAARTQPWQKDTIANVYSTTKGVVALLASRLAEQGRLDFDAPVVRYWPEFGQKGKERILVRELLGHRAGLPAVRNILPDEALYDWAAMTDALAAEEPWWEPGSAHGYHAVTYGWLIGEVLRRISGKSVGALFREEIGGPLGLDFTIGLAECEDARCAELTPPPPVSAEGEPNLMQLILSDPSSVTALAFLNPPSLLHPGTVNSRAWRGAEIPGANGHGNARSLAKLYGAVANGTLLAAETVARASEEQSYGPDIVLRLRTRFGLGFMLSQPGNEFGPNEGAFGHPGAGGSVAFADPKARVGFSYVMNRMGPYILLDPRAQALIDACYRSL